MVRIELKEAGLIFRKYYKGLSIAMSFLRGLWRPIMPERMNSLASFAAPRLAGTFGRMRWFLRYARGEARLCRQPARPFLS